MSIPDHANIVAAVKTSLVLKGVDLSGPCGAFEITRRVAWVLRSEGAGTLAKTSGNACNGQAVDIICYQDGSYVDMLVDGGGANTPAWNVKADKVDPSRYRAAVDPGDTPAPSPVPVPVPPTPPPAPTPAPELGEQLLEALESFYSAVEGLAAAVNGVRDEFAQIRTNGVRVHL